MEKFLTLIITLTLMLAGSAYAAPAIMNPDRLAPITIESTAFTVSGSATVVAAVTGKKIKVFSILMSGLTSTTQVHFQNGLTSDFDSAFVVGSSVISNSVNPPAFLFSTSSGTSLTTVTTGTVSGRVSYWTDDSN